MSTSIIRFENTPDVIFYCKDGSCPATLGFELLEISETENKQFLSWICENKDRFEQVYEIPKDIQYEYVISKDNYVRCQECWYTPDISYHGGGFRHGGTYDLKEWREKVRLQKLYTYRNEEAFEEDRKRKEKTKLSHE